MSKICSKCQTENLMTSKFCKKCGTPLSDVQVVNNLSDIENRLEEEKLYEQVATDLKNGIRKEGLYAKTLADANGSEEYAKALYIKYAVQAIKDEKTLQAEQERIIQQQQEDEARKQQQEDEARKQQQEDEARKLIEEQERIARENEREENGKLMKELGVVILGALFVISIVFSLMK